MTNESEPMITGAPTSPMDDARAIRLGEALSANLKLAAGDRGGRRDLRDLRPGIGRFPERHISNKIVPAVQRRTGLKAFFNPIQSDRQPQHQRRIHAQP